MYRIHTDKATLEQSSKSYAILKEELSKHINKFQELIKIRENQFKIISQRTYDTNRHLRMTSDIQSYNREWIINFSKEAANLISQLGLTEHIQYAYLHIIAEVIKSYQFTNKLKIQEIDYIIHRTFIRGKSSSTNNLIDLIIIAAYSFYNYKAVYTVINTDNNKAYTLESSIETLYGADMSITNMLYICELGM